MPLPARTRCALLTALIAFAPAGGGGATASSGAPAPPAWVRPVPGTLARVDVAPWLDADEPEAALTASPASLRRDFSADGRRPGDVVYEPIGVLVRIVRMLPGGIVEVRAAASARHAYAPQNRVLPDVPPGAALRVAGGFGGAADFFPELDTPESAARTITTGTSLVALRTAAAPYDPDSSDLVRVRVRVAGGPATGTIGWIAVAYVGTPETTVPAHASIVERACRCRPAAFFPGA